jgi:high-affinity Fe2+/Pb2+ permease
MYTLQDLFTAFIAGFVAFDCIYDLINKRYFYATTALLLTIVLGLMVFGIIK